MKNEWEANEIQLQGNTKSVKTLFWESEKKNDIWDKRKDLIKTFGGNKTCFVKLVTYPFRKASSGYGFVETQRSKLQLWQLDLLRTDEWIDLVGQQGFPAQEKRDDSIGYCRQPICKDVSGLWRDIRNILSSIPGADNLSLFYVDQFQIGLENWGSDKLTLLDMEQLHLLNEKYFEVKYEVEYAPGFGEKTIEELETNVRNAILSNRVDKQYIAIGCGDL